MNGPENISKYSSVPLTDRPAPGLLRLTPIKAQQLNLNADQVIRGIVADDGKSVQFLFDNFAHEFRSNFENWKGRTIEFRVSIEGGELKKIEIPPRSDTHANVDFARLTSLHPKSLMTMLANPNYGQLGFLSQLQTNSFMKWVAGLYSPLSAAVNLMPLAQSIKRVDADTVKKQLKSNGFRIDDSLQSQTSSDPSLTIKQAIGLLGVAISGKASADGEKFSAEDIGLLTDYLNANAIEYVLKQDKQELGLRFILLFSDFPATEVIIKGESTNPKKRSAFKYSLEVKLIFAADNSVWCRLELLSERAISIDFLFSEREMAVLASAQVGELTRLFQQSKIELRSCSVREGTHYDAPRKELLKNSGNVDLSA